MSRRRGDGEREREREREGGIDGEDHQPGADWPMDAAGLEINLELAACLSASPGWWKRVLAFRRSRVLAQPSGE